MKERFFDLFNEYIFPIEEGMRVDIQFFLRESVEVQDYDVTTGNNELLIINIKLCNYATMTAKQLFVDFMSFIMYSKVNLFVCNDMADHIEYIYLTTGPEELGARMKITIS